MSTCYNTYTTFTGCITIHIINENKKERKKELHFYDDKLCGWIDDGQIDNKILI